MVERFKKRVISRMTKWGKVRAYGPHLASSALFASHIVGKPWLGEYTLPASLASLILHEADDWTKVPTVAHLLRGKGTATSSFDALVLNTGIITGLLLLHWDNPLSFQTEEMGIERLSQIEVSMRGEGVPSLTEITSIQNLPGFAPPSFDQAYGGQA